LYICDTETYVWNLLNSKEKDINCCLRPQGIVKITNNFRYNSNYSYSLVNKSIVILNSIQYIMLKCKKFKTTVKLHNHNKNNSRNLLTWPSHFSSINFNDFLLSLTLLNINCKQTRLNHMSDSIIDEKKSSLASNHVTFVVFLEV
jgi:hypothetical protein